MSGVTRTGAGVVLALALASPAHAAGGGGEGLFWPLVNFALLVGVLFAVARKPIRSFFATRTETIRREIDEAASLKRQAERRYAQWQRKLGELEGEIEEIRRVARERAEAEREHLLADARSAAERIRRDAEVAVDQEVQRARAHLRNEASELAVELAAGILREQVGDGDRERLLDEFIERIERAPGAEA